MDTHEEIQIANNIEAMSDREFAAGLMRGNAETFQAGYSPGAAVNVVVERRNLTTKEQEHLMSWAEGFCAGMNESNRFTNPVEWNV